MSPAVKVGLGVVGAVVAGAIVVGAWARFLERQATLQEIARLRDELGRSRRPVGA